MPISRRLTSKTPENFLPSEPVNDKKPSVNPFARSNAKLLAAALALAFGIAVPARADDPPKNEEDLRREAAIAEFTRKMKEANYPALFEKAGKEFNVPADILKGVAFAETRWDHLMWPTGETRSPENGMPRPYGIMSLWDNEFFGHTLNDAAQLIGKDPDDLKKDPLQNMRGAAALLRRLYERNAKPSGTTEQDIESWRYAIVKYCGIPEPDLSNRHALEVYEFMNQGYHQYGIEWDAHPVNLAPMRQEVKMIVEQERAKAAALNPPDPQAQAPGPNAPADPSQSLAAPAAPQLAAASTASEKKPAAAVAAATLSSTSHATGLDRPALIILWAAILLSITGYLVLRRPAKS